MATSILNKAPAEHDAAFDVELKVSDRARDEPRSGPGYISNKDLARASIPSSPSHISNNSRASFELGLDGQYESEVADSV